MPAKYHHCLRSLFLQSADAKEDHSLLLCRYCQKTMQTRTQRSFFPKDCLYLSKVIFCS